MPKLAYSGVTRAPLKPAYWVGSSLKDLRACPEEVQDVVGYALFLAQEGKQQHPAAKPLKGAARARGGRRGSCERDLSRGLHGEAGQRGLRAPRLPEKATRGIATPKHELDLIKARLQWAQRHARGGVEEL